MGDSARSTSDKVAALLLSGLVRVGIAAVRSLYSPHSSLPRPHLSVPAVAAFGRTPAALDSTELVASPRRRSFKDEYIEMLRKDTSIWRGGHYVPPPPSVPQQHQVQQRVVVQPPTQGGASTTPETPAEFDAKKRKLMLLLDQATQVKMKVAKAFPDKLAEFGDTSRFGLNWHPGWREPARYVPALDSDPYRGSCRVSGCACGMFQHWPTDDGLYVYNPATAFPENMLCLTCRHLKTEHVLEPKVPPSSLDEFKPENRSKYEIRYSPDLPPAHPMDIPLHQLQQYYALHPEHPGASEDVHIQSLSELEGKQATSLADIEPDDELFQDD